jgi:hypothetical protein
MKKLILILFALSIPFLAVYSQDSYIKNRLNIKAGYAHNSNFLSHSYRFVDANYRLEANYGFLKFLETGIYLGYRWLDTYQKVDGVYHAKNVGVPFFGVVLNVHPLTFLIKRPDFRFDLYLLARYGGYYLATPENYLPPKGFYFQYHYGVGLAYYLTKHVGIFSEYSYVNLWRPSWGMRFGLSLKFH